MGRLILGRLGNKKNSVIEEIRAYGSRDRIPSGHRVVDLNKIKFWRRSGGAI
jgi:hypothetical protein